MRLNIKKLEAAGYQVMFGNSEPGFILDSGEAIANVESIYIEFDYSHKGKRQDPAAIVREALIKAFPEVHPDSLDAPANAAVQEAMGLDIARICARS